VTLVQYGNYANARCCYAHRIVAAIRQQIGQHVCFVFRHFPLDTIYPFAQYTAEMAEAAGAQGRFWEIHTFLFERQPTLDNGQLLQYAASLGLNVDRLEREVAEHVYLQRIHADLASGLQSGVNGTPTFFINNERYNGAWHMEPLLLALQQAAHPA